MQQQCDLEAALGQDAPCPAELCAFWDDQCGIAAIKPEFATNPALAAFLADLRGRIEHAAPTPPLGDHALLPPGLR